MEISKTKIDRLGDRLRKGNIADDDLRLLDEYRRSFTQAYEYVVGSIRQKLALEPTGRPAKSTTSISEKLKRKYTVDSDSGYSWVSAYCNGDRRSGTGCCVSYREFPEEYLKQFLANASLTIAEHETNESRVLEMQREVGVMLSTVSLTEERRISIMILQERLAAVQANLGMKRENALDVLREAVQVVEGFRE